MADLSSILGNIPGYGGFLAQQQLGQQKRAEDLATNVNQMKLADLMMQTKRQQDLQKIYAATSGDPVKAIPLLMQSGYGKEAVELGNLAKQQQEQTQQSTIEDARTNIATATDPSLQNIQGGVGYGGMKDQIVKENLGRVMSIDEGKGKAMQALAYPDVQKPEATPDDIQKAIFIADQRFTKGTPEWKQEVIKQMTKPKESAALEAPVAVIKNGKPVFVSKQEAVSQGYTPYYPTTDVAAQGAVAGAKVTGAEKGKRAINMAGLSDTIDEAKSLLSGTSGKALPTESGFGTLIDTAASVYGGSPEGAAEAERLRTIGATLTSKMPRMEGPQSDRDVQLYKEMAGIVGDSTKPRTRRLAALEEVEKLWGKYAENLTEPTTPTSDLLSVTTPDGKIIRFKSPQAAAAFRKKAGL